MCVANGPRTAAFTAATLPRQLYRGRRQVDDFKRVAAKPGVMVATLLGRTA